MKYIHILTESDAWTSTKSQTGLHKLCMCAGIEAYKIDLDAQKVSVEGNVDREEVLKRILKSGKRAILIPKTEPPEEAPKKEEEKTEEPKKEEEAKEEPKAEEEKEEPKEEEPKAEEKKEEEAKPEETKEEPAPAPAPEEKQEVTLTFNPKPQTLIFKTLESWAFKVGTRNANVNWAHLPHQWGCRCKVVDWYMLWWYPVVSDSDVQAGKWSHWLNVLMLLVFCEVHSNCESVDALENPQALEILYTPGMIHVLQHHKPSFLFILLAEEEWIWHQLNFPPPFLMSANLWSWLW